MTNNSDGFLPYVTILYQLQRLLCQIRWTLYSELEGMIEEMVVANFKVPSQHLLAGIEETMKKSELLVSGLGTNQVHPKWEPA